MHGEKNVRVNLLCSIHSSTFNKVQTHSLTKVLRNTLVKGVAESLKSTAVEDSKAGSEDVRCCYWKGLSDVSGVDAVAQPPEGK